MKDHRKESYNAFNLLPVNDRRFVQECAAWYHYRDGVVYEDGSMGSIKISSKQLRDILAYAIIWGEK